MNNLQKSNKERQAEGGIKPHVIRRISGCVDCPFCQMNDMAAGYSCKIDNERKMIRESKKYMPITPAFCPLKNEPMLIGYGV